ncbi:serine/threonine protein kinase, partial [Ruminococcaceae bacterium OttesenSCG-928-L11]|nr:serine/threonine protein kinase [Ruminococcaceae bacterium OttesenSCG-928-L11]
MDRENRPVILAGTYEIRETIGSGGGGVVYKAWHTRLQKEVVLKEMTGSGSARLETQRAEVDILKSLKHSYLPQVYDFIQEDGKTYTAMEYIQGWSLDKLLEKGEPFSRPQVVKWTRQLCQALEYLHGQQPPILHSDIKPANVMLTPSGDICLIDFNISLMLGDDGAIAVGRTHGYASPEQYAPIESILGTSRDSSGPADTEAVSDTDMLSDTTVVDDSLTGATFMEGDSATEVTGTPPSVPQPASNTMPIRLRLDVRSDIYSLGATIYHLLTGQKPQRMATDVIPLSATGHYGKSLSTLVETAMNPDPSRRYQSMTEMLAAVNRLHRDDPRY